MTMEEWLEAEQRRQLYELRAKLNDVLYHEPVDSGDEVEGSIWEQANTLKATLDDFFEKEQPTIFLPPNDPLTMEELREIEGKPFPVWCDKINGYIFIAATKTEPYNQVWFFNHKGRCNTVLYYHTKFYRRNPEEDTV